MMKRALVMITAASCSIVLILLFTTNPGNISPAGMLGVFILGYVSLLGIVTFLLYYGAKIVHTIVHAITRRTIRAELSFRRAYLYASVLATLPMMIMSLHSAGGIMWYEPFLVAMFGVIGVLYVAKRV